jgi:hypothetical protein
MDGGIITMPLRIGVGSARLALRTAAGAAGCAAKLGGRATVTATQAAARVSDALTWGRPAPSFEPPTEAAAPVVSDLRPARDRSVNGDLSELPRSPTPRASSVAPPEPELRPEPEPLTPTPVEPVHVSEEPELVQEVAEPGAEDGAGASVTVDEPWPGYARMTARDVIARLADATPAELAAVQLYESFHRDRQTVRAAAERNLKSKTGRGSPD